MCAPSKEEFYHCAECVNETNDDVIPMTYPGLYRQGMGFEGEPEEILHEYVAVNE